MSLEAPREAARWERWCRQALRDGPKNADAGCLPGAARREPGKAVEVIDAYRQSVARAFAVPVLGPDLDPAGGFLDTAAHLAGALGRPVWLALSRIADGRWLTGRNDTPWYPTLRPIRQRRLGAWAPVLTRIGAALRAGVRGRRRPPGR